MYGAAFAARRNSGVRPGHKFIKLVNISVSGSDPSVLD